MGCIEPVLNHIGFVQHELYKIKWLSIASFSAKNDTVVSLGSMNGMNGFKKPLDNLSWPKIALYLDIRHLP